MTQTAYPGFPPTPPPTPPTPQYPAQPSYPVAPGQLPGYGYPPPQQYAPGYPPIQPMPPAAPLAHGSIDDFFNQPSAGGGKSLAFKAVGSRYIGIVTRPLGQGDIQQQTDTTGRPQFFRDGRPKFVMKVPLQMQPTAEYPDGLAQWFVKGQARDELVRAMAEAGAPAGPPEPSAVIDVTYVGDRQSGAGMNPAKQFRIVYTRPAGSTSTAAATPAAPPAAPPVAQAAAPAPMPAFTPPPPVAAPAVPQPSAAPAPGPQPPADLTPEQQTLLAQLTGAQQGG